MEGDEINQLEILKIQSCILIIQSCYIFDIHFGTENRADQLKKPPCTSEVN